MRTVVLRPRPAELEQVIERRHALGLDTFDEIWRGEYHMAPAPRFGHARLDDQISEVLRPYAELAGLVGTGPFNLGGPDDFRVPDRGYHREPHDAAEVYIPTAATVVEIVSPDDETWDKLPFYAAHGVGEVSIVEPETRRVIILARAGDQYVETGESSSLGIGAGTVERAIRWP
ncbi:MAG: Uma2 family endonuclease [Acidimicrobiales bacterium]